MMSSQYSSWLFMSTIPSISHSFSVHLMNCYFPNFWYSHVTEKRTSEGRMTNMRKKQDIIWEESTLWEQVERWVVRYLKKNHSEYQEMQTQGIELIDNNPSLWKLMNETDGVTLTRKDHETLHTYFELRSSMGTFEFEYYFLAGQMMTFSYGSMLAQLKKEMFETDARTSTHRIELLTNIRSDELEE